MGPSRRWNKRQRAATRRAAIALIALLATGASAAEFPNVVGAWKVPDRKRAASSYEQSQDAALTVKIARQDGDAFTGTVVRLNGKSERISGAFRRDARTFIYSSPKTAGMGTVEGNKMEICRTDAPCTVLIRSK